MKSLFQHTRKRSSYIRGFVYIQNQWSVLDIFLQSLKSISNMYSEQRCKKTEY
jgi:hypothetical protein